ncbi:MAG TPA: hypothetical protein VKI17_04065 [Gemmataceae bacterium]|nr:hypothetical protein [Gemmataceae bacterium]
MRNLLALLATAVIVFAAVGWYLGWYKIQTNVPQDGHQSINVDVNNKKIKEDILRGEQRLHKAIEGNKDEAEKSANSTTSAGKHDVEQ